MTQVLLIPINVDAFYTDGTAKLAAPLADFTTLPYYSAGTSSESTGGNLTNAVDGDIPPPPPPGSGVNSDHFFLSEAVFQKPNPSFSGDDRTWTPSTGLHLHWALPDALTSQRVDPKSNGKSRFPQVPNRWLVILSTKNAGTWTEQNSWVVESDYLYPDPGKNPVPCGNTAISFPIAPPDAFQEILDTPVPPPRNPTPADLAKYPFLYKAPFRCMGRNEVLSSWKTDTGNNEYLSQYNDSGLTAIGYGHPLFAAIYSNCHSVFGFHDDLSIAGYPRRYDLIGWYDDPGSDCLSLFQNLPAGTQPWDALKSEYEWVDASAGGELPALSAYYSRLEIDAALTGALPSSTSTLTVGNTATEALSAFLSQSLQSAVADQITTEEQLEAISLQPKIGKENIDLAAKFMEARHDKGFKKIHGGSLWSVRAKSTKSTVKAPSQDQGGQVTLPDGLASLLNDLNIAQQTYDASWNEIDSLRRRVFTDWYRLEYRRVSQTTSGPALPPIDDILAYSIDSALTQLQNSIAATGEVVITKDALGKAQVSIANNGEQYNVTVQYTFAQQLVQAVENLSKQLGAYNAGNAAQQAYLEYYLVQKQAPRFYQPTDPAVLLEGDAVVITNRNGADGTLNCTACASAVVNGSLTDSLRSNGTSSGIFSTLLSTIETLSQNGGQGFATQSNQPWNPVSLEWAAQVWPEEYNTSTGVSGEGMALDTNYINGTYELDVNAPDFLITKKPYGLANPESPYDYSGRAILVSHAPKSLQSSIGAYIEPLSLLSMKTWGLRDQKISSGVDYNYDLALFNWANTVFNIPNPSFLSSLKDPSTLTPAQIIQQQNEIATWMSQQYPFVTVVSNKKTLIDLVTFVNTNPAWNNNRPVINDTPELGNFSSLTVSEQAEDPLTTAISAYVAVSGKEILSQALSGFNDAMLTQQREFQLPVWDWRVVQLDDQKPYARDISRNIGHIKTAPVFDGAFLPIRSGVMQISGLTLVDSFGQFLPLDYGGFSNTQKSERMAIVNNMADSASVTAAENQNYIYLAPRFVQECRLNFRWLSASKGDTSGIGDEQEMNDHPATTPVCGWIVPNNLDVSLAVYSNDGTALGSLVQSNAGGTFAIVWESAPGTNNYMPLSQLPNPHLFDFVSNIITWGSGSITLWQDFLSSINIALQDIDPKSFAQNEALSLLIGRPMALVRTTLGLQAKGLPDVDHSVEAFNYNQANNLFTRLTNGFDNVQIPVRLGEASQLNDGLVAYWVEDGQGGYIAGTNGPVHFPEKENTGSIADALSLSIAGQPIKLTMLVDPRGVVHATSGMLPVKEISIPPDQYSSVLRSLSITFLTSPVITPVQQVQFPLPAEAGYGWSWLDRPTGVTWNRVADIKNAPREAKYEPQRILEGWLKLTPQTLKETN